MGNMDIYSFVLYGIGSCRIFYTKKVRNKMNIRELAKLISGRVEGDGNVDIKGIGDTRSAKAGDLTFAVDEDRLASVENTDAACVLTNKIVRKSTKPLIRVDDPKLSFVIIYDMFNEPKGQGSFRHPTALVSEGVKLGNNVWIGPNVVIGENTIMGNDVIVEDGSIIKRNCAIGSLCHIYPNVTLYENVVLHENVIIHSGVVLGADGFGYVKNNNKIYKFPQLGRVIIEENVEIGANTTVDRGSLGDTIIGADTKIDNLCQIAHNVKIGKNVLIAAQCGISGSTTIGDNVTMGGQAGIVDNVNIGDNVMIGAKSAIIGDVAKGSIVWGIPARPIGQTKRQMAVLSWVTKNFKNLSRIIR